MYKRIEKSLRVEISGVLMDIPEIHLFTVLRLHKSRPKQINHTQETIFCFTAGRRVRKSRVDYCTCNYVRKFSGPWQIVKVDNVLLDTSTLSYTVVKVTQ